MFGFKLRNNLIEIGNRVVAQTQELQAWKAYGDKLITNLKLITVHGGPHDGPCDCAATMLNQAYMALALKRPNQDYFDSAKVMNPEGQ